MKNSKIAFLILGILILPAFAFARPQVAVLDAVLAAGMDKTVAAPITDKIVEELVNSGKYTVIDRANVEQVLKEKEFQLSSGVVKNEEVRQAGEYLGADLVIVASASRVGSTYVITAKMIDVVTGEIVAQASSEQKGSIDVVLEVARTVGRQISGQKVVVTESRAQEIVKEPVKEPAKQPAKVETTAVAPAGGNAAVTMQMQALIKSKAHMRKAGQLQMLGLADQLSDTERLFLYTSNRKENAGMVLLLNWLLPSLGSWIQGDASGALVELSWLTVGVVGMTTGWSSYYDWYYGYYYEERNAFYYVGVSALVFYVVYYCVRPFTFQRQWNTNLARSLKTISLSVLDEDGMTFGVYPTERGPEWRMGLSLVSFEY
jgi:TolB-like protein